MGDLGGIAHAQQTARFQVHCDGVAITLLGTDQHAARVTQRYQGNGVSGSQGVQLVVMHGHTVATVAVKIESNAVVGRMSLSCMRASIPASGRSGDVPTAVIMELGSPVR